MIIYTLRATPSLSSLWFLVPPILASIFILPLFPFSINLITDKDGGGFGEDETGFRKRLLFVLMGLQFVPALVSMALMLLLETENQDLRIIQLLGNCSFMLAALVLKVGNHQKSDDSF